VDAQIAMHDPPQDQNSLALVAPVAPVSAVDGGASKAPPFTAAAPVSAPTLAALERAFSTRAGCMDAYSDSCIVSELAAFAAGEHKEDEAPWWTMGRSRPSQGKFISSKFKAFKASFEPAAGGESEPASCQGHPEGGSSSLINENQNGDFPSLR